MLAGIRIVEVEGLGPAPFAAMMLAELGAEVTVIHRPDAAKVPGMGGPNALDRGKRSIALDLKSAADAAIARALIAAADGVIEGFRPGVMERLGLGPGEMLSANPALVYGRMTGWGQTGPRAREAGHDLNYAALSGALWYAGLPGDAPFPPPTMLGDIGGGALYLVIGMLAGLIRARATGHGTVVDAAIVDGTAHMMGLLMAIRASGGVVTERGASVLDGPHWSRSYPCADGRFMTVQCLEPKFYAIFLDRLGLAQDPDMQAQFDRALWPAQTARLAALFATRTQGDWSAVFAGTDACVAPVHSPDTAVHDPHIAARGVWGTGHTPAPAPRFDTPTPPLRPAPVRDADRAAILADLRTAHDPLRGRH